MVIAFIIMHFAENIDPLGLIGDIETHTLQPLFFWVRFCILEAMAYYERKLANIIFTLERHSQRVI